MNYVGNNENLQSLITTLTTLYDSADEMKDVIDNKEKGVQINIDNRKDVRNLESPKGLNPTDNNLVSGIRWNPTQKGAFEGTPVTSLGHELAHSYDRIYNNANVQGKYDEDGCDVPIPEIFAVHVENKIRAKLMLPLRRYYYADEYGHGVRLQLVIKGKSVYYDVHGIYVKNRNKNPYVY